MTDPPPTAAPPPMAAAARGTGGRGAPLVYLPGIDGSGELLLDTASRLERGFRLLRLSYVVRGPAPLGGDRYESLAASVVERVDGARMERPLLLAESFGVALALRVALDFPERVAGLALVNGFARYPWRARLALARAICPLVPRPVFRAARWLLSARALMWPRYDAAVVRAFRRTGLSSFDEGYPRRLDMVRRVDLVPELPTVACPVALFAAAADRVVPSVPAARAMAAALPDATLEVLPRAGHLVLPLPEEPWLERLRALGERAR